MNLQHRVTETPLAYILSDGEVLKSKPLKRAEVYKKNKNRSHHKFSSRFCFTASVSSGDSSSRE